jgi:hypothetical protein
LSDFREARTATKRFRSRSASARACVAKKSWGYVADMDGNASRPPTAVSCPLDQISDDELLRDTRRLVGQSNRVLAALLAHLSEVEARGVHRVRACASLYTYCIYELRMSEDTAFRRVAASRLVRRFPSLLDAIERGELHLTGLLLLGPHLTESNIVEVLARAKHRTKKEILGLVRQLSPLPDVPSRVEPLGPQLSRRSAGTRAGRTSSGGCAPYESSYRESGRATGS